ncbi:hypothetical protein D9X30_5101 [Cupriavidus sp. U2]|nr:hypothetical protein D9X30_5101 [Cupriavidus sp. U2]
MDDLDNIHGEIDASGRAAILDFASFFDAQRGRATLKAADEKVLWTVEIEPIGGDYFATRNAILQRRPVVSPGNECRFN